MTTELVNEQVATMSLPKAEFLNATVVRESAEEVLGDSKGTVKKLVAALVAKFAGSKNMATCDKCAGVSPATLPRCPFCGDADIEEVSAEIEKKESKAAARIAKADKIPPVTRAIYDKKFAALVKCKEKICVDFWELGNLCKDFQDSRAWMAAADKNGKPLYKSFEAWATDEAGFSKTYVYGVMSLVKSFTEEQVKKYGKTHMLALTSSEEQDRPFLISELEKNPEMPTAEFQKLVVHTKAARKTTKLKPKKEPQPRVTVEQTPIATPKAITAVFPLERAELEMFARIQSGEQVRPATDIAEQPWAKMALENGVDVFFGLAKRADGQFVLTVQAVRNDG